MLVSFSLGLSLYSQRCPGEQSILSRPGLQHKLGKNTRWKGHNWMVRRRL
jgi:hypothetical protein